MIQVVCPHCRAQGKAPEKLAGKTLPCPKCKGSLTVPALSEDELLSVLDEAPAPEPPRQKPTAAPARKAVIDDAAEDDVP